MQKKLLDCLKQAPIVPLIQDSDSQVAIDLAKALVAGGLKVLEVVLRSERALDCLEQISASVSDAVVGAGTVLNEEHARQALSAGAQFLVSPGLDPPTIEVARKSEVAVFPGVATPSEMQAAWNLRLKTVKFFPAEHLGGAEALKAVSSVFRDLRFIPTGGINARNLSDYLRIPSVLACGGSWITPTELVVQKRFNEITGKAREAVSLALQERN